MLSGPANGAANVVRQATRDIRESLRAPMHVLPGQVVTPSRKMAPKATPRAPIGMSVNLIGALGADDTFGIEWAVTGDKVQDGDTVLLAVLNLDSNAAVLPTLTWADYGWAQIATHTFSSPSELAYQRITVYQGTLPGDLSSTGTLAFSGAPGTMQGISATAVVLAGSKTLMDDEELDGSSTAPAGTLAPSNGRIGLAILAAGIMTAADITGRSWKAVDYASPATAPNPIDAQFKSGPAEAAAWTLVGPLPEDWSVTTLVLR